MEKSSSLARVQMTESKKMGSQYMSQWNYYKIQKYIILINMAVQFESTLTYPDLLIAFRITIFAAWGFGVDFPRLLVRYARSYPSVMNIHGISMLIIGLLTIMYVIAKTSVYYSSEDLNDYQLVDVALAEFVFEWILLGLILIQFIIGSKVRFEMTNPELSTDMFWMKILHRYLGTAMSIIGKIVIALFLYPLQDSILFRSWLFVCGALLFIYVIMEIVYRIQTRSLMCKFPLKHQNKFERHTRQILDNINSNIEDFDDYKEIGLRYIILDNIMYYIDEKFIHPGGQHIFNLYNGQQVNYLFRGTHQLMPDFPRHRHTKYAMNYLQSRVVGQIQVDTLLLNYTSESQQLVDWRVNKLQKMQSDTFLVQFQAKDGYLKQSLRVQNFGKYMMISCPTQQIIGKVQRPYSLILSLCQYQNRILQRFKESYKYYYHGSQSASSSTIRRNDIEVAINNSTLTFCVKQYKHGAFTKFLLSSWAQKSFTLSGPYGRGLRLKGKTKGFHIIIGAGTGVFPFIDLFHYMLQKTLIKLITMKAGEVSAKKLNEERVDYSDLQGLKILFIGSFLSAKHFYLDSIIKDLYHLNVKHDLNQFDMMLRYNNMQAQPDVRMIKQTFDRSFIKSLIEMDPDRIYYCGPSSIEHTIRKVEEESQMRGKFYYI